MCADKSYINLFGIKGNNGNQPIIIAFNIKNETVVSYIINTVEILPPLTVFPEISPQRLQLLAAQQLQQGAIFRFPDFFDGAKSVE